ncbi:succinate dehydrogenase/fumarate reductase iron-sulfur subunit [Chryseobacterium indologenes]|uniref:Succinate dehydrogenase/fumarate reductase iron-sulfur subunit n=1 Tax=Chryseobacterium indologenes TaxID=253 RepID=A0AAD0YV74_CHRID|nr:MULTISPECIES: succinate dehydrogenase/fumarate reductase iron-sulfur subunit [Chryseobacterium]ATN06191.1 succinate dehydrogenase/fumarate reductase iron-sulfur subunit [Chryseobacterium indologenes]AYY85049.1 succinate dehydrogenase/fumarate reductase iron-sulfur subunit [Chryseobacterium indologenes]AYZ34720.1 succinate dehydrogenase/fumarate reductase iron-sulfur subunit [Chryseobacterium indologenes]AZB18068.1 succinate dehydrogenase/fumarate reductase iron-sulfur subunit [Chryseobacteri
MDLHLKIWRQKDRKSEGKLVDYDLKGLNSHMSFLEMLDTLNEKLITEGDEPVEFDHDCREGICGQCGMMINGIAHGPLKHTTTCQLHLRSFKDGETILIEPFRAEAFPVKKDLKVDRSAFDRIISSGGFVSINTGQAPDATAIPVTHQTAEEAFDSAACIGCGACVATCKNGSAALFTSAKITHMALLPQGKEERSKRVVDMVTRMDTELFGHCSNTEACEVECPQGISVLNIARMNFEYNRALFFKKK